MSSKTSSDLGTLPGAVYAAAGAGDLAYEQLRRLPGVAARTLRTAGATAGAVRERVRAGDRDLATGLDLVRESARQATATLAAQAVAAQERAVTEYRHLVTRGEQVVNELGVTTGHAESSESSGSSAAPAAPTKVEVTVGEPEREPSSSASAARGGGAARSTTTGSSTRGVGKTGTKASGKGAST